MGTPYFTYCTRPAAGYTLKLVPITTQMSASNNSLEASSILGTSSPNNTMWGLTLCPLISVSGVISSKYSKYKLSSSMPLLGLDYHVSELR